MTSANHKKDRQIENMFQARLFEPLYYQINSGVPQYVESLVKNKKQRRLRIQNHQYSATIYLSVLFT